jgi:hypothetical protein
LRGKHAKAAKRVKQRVKSLNDGWRNCIAQVRVVKIVIDNSASETKVRTLEVRFVYENLVNTKNVFITKPKVMEEAICNTLCFKLSTAMSSLNFLALR